MVEESLGGNDRVALDNEWLLEERGVIAVTIMASRRAGKTNLILHTIEVLRDRVRPGLTEGGLAGPWPQTK